MKKIYYLLLALLVTGFTFTACSDEDPFETVSESDFPMILDPVFPDRGSDGSLPIVATLNRDQTYELTARVTPSEYTTVKWYVDGVEVLTGLEFSALFKAGTYNLKVVATSTNGLSSYREGTLQVDPLDTDPSTTTGGIERIVAAGGTARLNGTNLNLVQYVVVDGQICPATYNEDGSITYTVPEGLADGEYRILLGDYNGVEYGGNTITVSSGTLVTGGTTSATVGEEWVITGTNLDQVTSLTVGDVEIGSADFLSQTKSEIVLECPELEAGSYTLKGQTTSGALQFYTTSGNVTETTIIISAAQPGETILWTGNLEISWKFPEGAEGQKFVIIPDYITADEIKAGSKIRIEYANNTSDSDYHQMQLTYMDWDPRLVTVEITSDGVYEFTLTQDILDTAKSKGGFIIVGHGFYLKKVSIIETQEGASGLPWVGHQNISWEGSESEVMFKVIPELLPIESVEVGDVLKASYSINTDATYHQFQFATPDTDWTSRWPEDPVIDNTIPNGVYELVFTQEIIDTIKSKGGLIITGHGYYLDMVSVQ